VPEAEMNELITAIEKREGIKFNSDKGCTKLCLSSKYQDFGDNGNGSKGSIFNFDRALIIVSPSKGHINALLCRG